MIIAVAGSSDSGKTVFVGKMIERLRERGFKVATVKHIHASDSLIPYEKDTTRHLNSGSDIAAGVSPNEAVMYTRTRDLETILDDLRKIADPDIIILEGFRESPYPKIVLGDIDASSPVILRLPSRPDSIADALELTMKMASSEELARSRSDDDCRACERSDCGRPSISLDNEFSCLGKEEDLSEKDVEIVVDGRIVPLGGFVSDIIANTISSMVRSLKHVGDPDKIEVRINRRK